MQPHKIAASPAAGAIERRAVEVLPVGQVAPNECPPARPPPGEFGFNKMDLAPVAALGEDYEALVGSSILHYAGGLAGAGGRETIRRLLARDASICLARLRNLQMHQGLAINIGNLNVAREWETLITAEHRRMHESLAAIARLDPAPASVTISARQAVVVNNHLSEK